MSEIEIPPYFICPISLEIMKDPVTVPTGITYDRDAIERWIFTRPDPTCPVTKQPIDPAHDPLIPNITLRRLIQSWCTLHAPDGFQRIPTPKAPFGKAELSKIIDQARRRTAGPQTRIKCLQNLRSIASQNQTNKRCMESAGAHEFLASLIIENAPRASSGAETSDDLSDSRKTCDEALAILSGLELSNPGLKALARPELVMSLTLVMRLGSYESRAYAIALLRSVLEAADDSSLLTNLRPDLFIELRHTLDDQVSQKATKETLKTLIVACPWGRNRIKAVESGLVPVLVELLLDSFDKRVCEMMLTVLDLLCQCAEGRAGLLGHGAGLAVVSKKILRVSGHASERAVRIVSSVSRFCAGPGVLHEMVQVGVVSKLCLVVRVDCGLKTKERAREILRMHSKAWRDLPCLPRDLVSSSL
ncbi:E3 ubiquitin-protein ligase PUB23 [Striga hermonthica]|uniref:U-box domain-containing protein n=1 Tax=Striga hermonthica TaxID=68872 RepID=A0A9N7RBK3_STRHE|nr:E3 ubiquitin-protein ligase PUB23 [Striga hermonthica]